MADATPTHWRLTLPRARSLELVAGRPLVMGVVNVTPDSFSDGGQFLDPDQAVAQALRLLEEGADLIDLGAESTRPGGGVYGEGASDVEPDNEWRRLRPVLERLREQTDAPLAIDTRKGAVARAALTAGADLINDVGGLRDTALTEAVAEYACPVVIMHSRGDLGNMQKTIAFEAVTREVADELAILEARATAAGIRPEQIIHDPGIGFGKTPSQNLDLIVDTGHLAASSRPWLIGASRKSFIAHFSPAPPTERLGGSLAALAWAVQRGAAMVRVHDVAASVQFLRLWHAFAERDPKHGSD